MHDLSHQKVSELFPEYNIIQHIASSGEAEIYKVSNEIGEILALKVLKIADKRASYRFIKEANIMNLLSHPYIVKVEKFGRKGDLCYATMEFINYDLLKVLSIQKMSDKQAGQMVYKIAVAIHFIHTKGVIHRDIKPANVMVTDTGSPKVIDFGLSYVAGEKLSEVESIGTAGYTAPEMYTNPEQVSLQTDIYSLGALLYTLLTRIVPDAHKVDFGKLFNNDENFIPFILKAMAKDPARRYKSVYEFAEELEEVLKNIGKSNLF